jgi:hypothetical protein
MMRTKIQLEERQAEGRREPKEETTTNQVF